MATNVRCAATIEGLVLRVIKLNACGVPVTGTVAAQGAAQIVMDGFTQVQDSPQYDAGDRKVTRKANGQLCQNYRIPDQFTNDKLTIDFCVNHPGLLVATIGARLLTATQSPTGTGWAHGTWANVADYHWSLELWQAPPQSCDTTGVTYYPYWAWPHIANAKRKDTTYSLDPTMLSLEAETQDASPLWTAGATYLGASQIVQGDHLLYNLQNTAPPPSACILADYP